MKPQLNAIGAVVSDMPRTLAFYKQFGLEFTGEDDHYECELPGGTRLMLDTASLIQSLLPHWQPPTGGHRIAFAFQFDSPAEVDAKHAEVVAAGGESLREPWDAFWGQRYASVLDPDGNAVDLYAAL
jgi:catechol 2,3-dioxygenase-like lactoylglutathione lyase family enzyme